MKILKNSLTVINRTDDIQLDSYLIKDNSNIEELGRLLVYKSGYWEIEWLNGVKIEYLTKQMIQDIEKFVNDNYNIPPVIKIKQVTKEIVKEVIVEKPIKKKLSFKEMFKILFK